MRYKPHNCPNCGAMKAEADEKESHILFHFFMCLITGLFWLPVWGLCIFANMITPLRWRCSNCACRV